MKKAIAVVSMSFALAACASTGANKSFSDLAGENLAKRQARSVHLFYLTNPSNRIDAAAVSVIVRESHPGTYFAVIGWDGGYCGIQEHVNGEHVLIFSVWDPVDPHDYSAREESVKEDIRAKILFVDPRMDVARFSGEGSGARTMAGCNWEKDVPIRFMVECAEDGADRVAYTCYLYDTSFAGGWRKIASISTLRNPGGVVGLTSLHSFVEDFRRDYESATLARRAEFADVQVMSEGKWQYVNRARFSADSTPSKNIDAGKVGEASFFLATGGVTQNSHTPLWGFLE